MATFGRGRLCAPITDDDLRQVDVDPDTGATTVTLLNDFVVSVNGTPTTVTVPLPSDAGLEYGYYTDATAEADSWLLALETAIEAAEGGSWTLAERGGDVCGNVTRYSYTRNGLGVGPVQFQMDNASTTIDPKLLGFDADTYSGSPTVNAPFAAPHCWRPGTISWVSTEPLRNVSQVKSASVKTSNHLTGGTQHREIIPSRNMPIAKVLKSGTVHDTDIAAVPNLANDDPNYPLESLWEVAWDHLPLKWLPVETLPGENVKYLQIDGSQALSDMRTFITKRSTNLRFFDVDLPLIQWEPIGGKEFDIHAVVCGNGVPIYSSIEAGLASTSDDDFFWVSYRESTDGRRPAGSFCTQRKGAKKISVLPVVIPPDAVGTVGGLWQPMSIGDSTSAMAFNGNDDLEQTFDNTIANNDTSDGGGVGRYLDERTGQNAYELGMYLDLEVERPGNIIFETENDGYPGVNTHYYYGYLKDQFQFLSVMANATGATTTLGTFAVSSVGTIGFTASGTGVPYTSWFSLQTQWRVVADADAANSVGTDCVWRGTGATSAAISQSGTNATLAGWLQATSSEVFKPFVCTTVYNATPSTADGSIFRITGVGQLAYIGESYP